MDTPDTLTLEGHTLILSHLDKVYFPPALTKGHLLEYYLKISPVLLPHIHDRLLTLQRFPDGITGPSFYQKNIPDICPSWVTRKRVRNKTEGSTDYVYCNSVAPLLYLAHLGTITFHRWLSTRQHSTKPDLIIFDIDPAHGEPINFDIIKHTARLLADQLEAAGLVPWVMTTGSRGLHVVSPIVPHHTFERVRAVARTIAQALVTNDPDHLTVDSRAPARKGKILIDIMRNSFGATAVAPYTVRALPGAPVATPLDWQELAHVQSAHAYTIANILTRVAQRGDCWEHIAQSAKQLPEF